MLPVHGDWWSGSWAAAFESRGVARRTRSPHRTEEPGVPAHDFTLPSDAGRPFVFDAALRVRQRTLLFFYRGHW